MCRHLGYLGPARSLEELLYGGTTSLEVQSYAPRRQVHGLINADGWGVGWYGRGDAARTPATQRDPARYRTARPMWADTSFRGIAAHLQVGHVVASVRSATPPAPSEESGVAPFTGHGLLFAHNGLVERFADGIGTELRRTLDPALDAAIVGASDSEVLFAMVLARLDAGDDLPDALRRVIATVRSRTSGRFNLLVADGRRLVATRAGDTLVVRDRGDEGRWIASEPLDDGDGWHDVDDESLVVVTDAGVEITAL